MPLLSLRRAKQHDDKVDDARRQVHLAVDKMTRTLDKVEEQTLEAKEELDEGRAG